MLKKTIKYVDFNGEKREENFYFNLTKAELTQMQLSIDGGFYAKLQDNVAKQNVPEITKVFTTLILESYGEKSDDGKSFIKLDKDGRKLSIGFSQTAAYAELFMELATNEKAATDFINAVCPQMDAAK